MYECHITFENVDSELEVRLLAYASEVGWKTSFIDGDPALGPGKRFFLTSHASNLEDMYVNMRLVSIQAPAVPIREKIEQIVHDTKYNLYLERMPNEA